MPEYYIPGGFHPVQIDDRLHTRYRIVNKLGYGSSSTVWLALDEQTSKYVAIKVGTAGAGREEEVNLSRLRTGLATCSHATDKLSMIDVPLDSFSLDGPNGHHDCLVKAPARCSLRDAREASWSGLFQPDVAQSLAAQLAVAVSLVHSQGYAHGALHLGNLLLQLPFFLDNLSVEQLYDKFGAPKLDPLVRIDKKPILPGSGIPSHVVQSMWLGVKSSKVTLNEARLSLGDFGAAFRPSDKSPFEAYIHRSIIPPEAVFEPTTPPSFAADIWSLGCMIFELLSCQSLFGGWLAPQDHITAEQVHLLGIMPPEWWNKWEQRPKWFDEFGRPLSKEGDIWRWDRIFEECIQKMRQDRGMPISSEEEKVALLELLQWMLAWRPSERPNAEQVLGTTWMKKWALPAFEESRKTWE
ncbi:kinase-like domain-containing protein [Dactylonectria macrodidyma]|uniref:Kinase-like domain-containing protein n=1 Tax=Dactylonectria macrodidyma TaxID=307937 RepID=A0A9P9JDS1_9HYPO|nr:kinase-like domain-containing protein [Dactylonectria macrodidyma]